MLVDSIMKESRRRNSRLILNLHIEPEHLRFINYDINPHAKLSLVYFDMFSDNSMLL